MAQVDLAIAGLRDVPNFASIPDWAFTPLEIYMEHLQELVDVTFLARAGISVLPAMAPIVEATHQRGTAPPGAWSTEEAHRYGKLAASELQRGLPLLYGQAAIATWSVLEHYVKSVARAWLVNNIPEAMTLEQISRIKIPVGEYMLLSDEGRVSYIMDTLERDLRVADGEAIGGFERLLGVFGLGGPVENDVRKSLFELSKIRNVLAHRRGVVDERLMRSLPQGKYIFGERVSLRGCCVAAFQNAASGYVTEIFVRIAVKFGVSREGLSDALMRWQRSGAGCQPDAH